MSATPLRNHGGASSEDVQVLSPSAATPSSAASTKKEEGKERQPQRQEAAVDSEAGRGDQGASGGGARVGSAAPGLLVPTVSRDASDDVGLEGKSGKSGEDAAAAVGGFGGKSGEVGEGEEGKPLLRKNSTDIIGPGNFQKIKLLGKGDVGLVFLVKARNIMQLNGTFAMKVYKKSDIVKRNKVARVKLEREILSVTHHPFVVSMYAAFQTQKRLYVILQYCPGGELYRMIKRQPNGRIPEEWARFYAAEILIAVEYLHFMGYLYRDLKPENILLHATGHVMIADFDLAKHQVHEFTEKEKQQGASVMQFKKSHGHRSAHSSIGTPSSSVVELPERGTASSSSSSSAAAATTASAAKKAKKSANVVVDQRTGQPVVLLNQKSYRFGAPVAKTQHGGRKSGGCCSCGAKAVLRPVLDTETQLAVDAFGDHLSTSFVGTIEYVAPEVIMQEGYSGSVDWWTFGVLLYEMVFGKTPFKGKDMNGTLAHVLNADIDFDMPDDDEIPASKELRDLLPKLLEREVSDRLKSPDAIRSHPFFATIAWPLLRHMQPPYMPTLASETDTGNFRAFANFVDSDSDFEEDVEDGEEWKEGEEEDGGSSSKHIDASTPAKYKPPSTPVSAAAEVDSSSDDGEDLISPAITSRNTAVFKNFAYVDRLGERHWDLTYTPPDEYGAMKRVRGEHIESPASKQRREKDSNKA